MAISKYRTAVWQNPFPGVLPVPLIWPSKRALEILDYSLDLTDWLADIAGAISSVSPSTLTPGLLVAPLLTGFFGNICTVMLSGGTAGTQCQIDFTVMTTSGEIGDFVVQIGVVAAQVLPVTTPGSTYILRSGSFLVTR